MVTFTVEATVSANATDTLENTATVEAPGGVADLTPSNNSATDTDTLTPTADLSISKTDGQVSALPGQPLTYTIVVSNAGPSAVTDATVSDALPAGLSGVSWTCAGSADGSCVTEAGDGDIDALVSLPAGGLATFTVNATVSASATASLANTATVTVPAGVTDPMSGNNSATDTDTVIRPAAITLKINGQHPPPHVVTVAGPMLMTLDVSPGSYTASVDWYWALSYNGTLSWVTAAGLSTTPAPWFSAPPVTLTSVTLLNFTLPPASTVTSMIFMLNGATTVSFDYITARRP
jgi:uncharacterized repeat protein (TIGR01451 family)